jgi:hypothetical protein
MKFGRILKILDISLTLVPIFIIYTYDLYIVKTRRE